MVLCSYEDITMCINQFTFSNEYFLLHYFYKVALFMVELSSFGAYTPVIAIPLLNIFIFINFIFINCLSVPIDLVHYSVFELPIPALAHFYIRVQLQR